MIIKNTIMLFSRFCKILTLLYLINYYSISHANNTKYLLIHQSDDSKNLYEIVDNSTIIFNDEYIELSFDNSTLLLSAIKKLEYVSDKSSINDIYSENLLEFKSNNNFIFIKNGDRNLEGYLFNSAGILLETFVTPAEINISDLTVGVYIIKIKDKSLKFLKK